MAGTQTVQISNIPTKKSNSVTPEMKQILRFFEKALIDKDYQSICDEKGMSILTASEIEGAVKEYKGEITKCPEEELDNLYIIKVRNTDLPTWAFDFDLWMDNKKSDLTLQLTIVQNKDGSYKGSLDDLHTL